jgi:transposase-like protein
MKIQKRRSDRSGRAPLSSPGRPSVAGRDERRRFWAAIAVGLESEDAALEAGVPPAVGTRWFRKAGGIPPAMFGQSAKPLSGRYLSFAEREEIALLRAQGYSMREVARRLGRAASTISRELRRNAATRSGGLEYRATTAQWHAERAARRPKQGKLAINTIASLCGGTTGWHRRRSERGSCARPSRILERPSTWTAEGSAVGKRLEPGADRPPAPGRLPGR